MTTITGTLAPPSGTWLALTARELRRFVLNPVFLAGVALNAYGIWSTQQTVAADVDTFVTFPATYLGGFGMLAAFWQTRSLRRSAAVADVSPVTLPARTAAICATAAVTLLLGLASLVAIVRFQQVAGDFAWGTLSGSDRAGTLVSQLVLPALGGPLLGVALGRWVRFPGGALAAFLVCWGWMSIAYILSVAHPAAAVVRAMRLFAPFTFFTAQTDSGQIQTWGGQPWCFAGWQLSMCAVALLAALLRGADGAARRRIAGGLIAAGAAAVVLYALAVAL
jgi:hypothetical protein